MQSSTAPQPTGLRARLAEFLSLEANVSIASAAVFLLGLGEELWKKFLPKYLEALGASTPVIGLFGTAEDFFDAIYQYIAERVQSLDLSKTKPEYDGAYDPAWNPKGFVF